MTDIRGLCPDRFAAVREAFTANFAEGHELGARFALAIEGEIVIDLMGGSADRAGERPFDEHTLTPLFSTTKAIAAFMIARLVDDGALASPSDGAPASGRGHRRAPGVRPVPGGRW